jgi:UDP-2-acetamido-3-amino-2,3-dideoxy-glucuronate N-acetyltransferase
LIVGNPGRQTGWMSEYGQKLQFDKDGNAVCSESNETYQLTGNIVTRK